MQNLASQADVAALLGRPLTSEELLRVEVILTKLSAQFRMYAGQDFTPAESSVRLEVVGGSVLLRQRPVVAVSSVLDDGGNAVSFMLVGNVLTVDADVPAVTVTYTHGDSEVPDLCRATVADAASRALLVPLQALQGIASHSLTTASISEQTTYSSTTQMNTSGLSADEIAVAKSYRVRRPRAIVSQA